MGVLHILQLVVALLSARIKEPRVFYLLEKNAPNPKGTRHGDMPLGSLLISKLNKVSSELFLDLPFYLFHSFSVSSNLTSAIIVLNSPDISCSLSISTKMMTVFILSDYDFEVLIYQYI